MLIKNSKGEGERGGEGGGRGERKKEEKKKRGGGGGGGGGTLTNSRKDWAELYGSTK